jgi:hypothetical protein
MPTTIPTLPPAPSDRSDPATYNTVANTWAAALPAYTVAMNTLGGELTTIGNTATASQGAAATSATNSSNSATLAGQWATLATLVASTDYSSKEYATGVTAPLGSSKNWATQLAATVASSGDYSSKEYATGVTAPLGSSKNWATKANTAVASGEFSAKEHAVGTSVTTGSAKDWATKLASEVVTGQGFGARKYANDAAASSAEATALNIRYQGVSSFDPIVNKTGGALVVGDWYLRTTDSLLRVYNGTIWVTGVGSVAGVSSINTQTGDLTLPPLPLFSLGVI